MPRTKRRAREKYLGKEVTGKEERMGMYQISIVGFASRNAHKGIPKGTSLLTIRREK